MDFQNYWKYIEKTRNKILTNVIANQKVSLNDLNKNLNLSDIRKEIESIRNTNKHKVLRIEDDICLFPDEGFAKESFVQKKVAEYFCNLGFHIALEVEENVPYLDYLRGLDILAINEKSNLWIVECKGRTANNDVDFYTGLGQIFTRMFDSVPNYALAMPDMSNISDVKDSHRYNNLVKKLPPRMKKYTHWIWVDQNGNIKIE